MSLDFKVDGYVSIKELSDGREFPFKVVSYNGTEMVIVAISEPTNDKSNSAALGYKADYFNATEFQWDIKNIKVIDLHRKHWKIWSPPELFPHWPAVRLSNRVASEDGYSLSSVLYYSEDVARQNLKSDFVRLAKELPAVMLPKRRS